MSYNNQGQRPQQPVSAEFQRVLDSLPDHLKSYLIKAQGGKPYFNVQGRLVVAREKYGESLGIVTEVVKIDLDAKDPYAIFHTKVTLYRGEGDVQIIGSATSMESRSGFGDFLQKAETSSVGRALLMAGIGIQYGAGDDVDEGRVVDSPMNNPVVVEPVAAYTAPVAVSGVGLTANVRSENPSVNARMVEPVAKTGDTRPMPKPISATGADLPKSREGFDPHDVRILLPSELENLPVEEKQERASIIKAIFMELINKEELSKTDVFKNPAVKEVIYKAVSMALFAHPEKLGGFPQTHYLRMAAERIAMLPNQFLYDWYQENAPSSEE